MKSVLKVNNINRTTITRLRKSGFLHDGLTADETFLSLRYYYQQAPMLIYIPATPHSTLLLTGITCQGVIKMMDTTTKHRLLLK